MLFLLLPSNLIDRPPLQHTHTHTRRQTGKDRERGERGTQGAPGATLQAQPKKKTTGDKKKTLNEFASLAAAKF